MSDEIKTGTCRILYKCRCGTFYARDYIELIRTLKQATRFPGVMRTVTKRYNAHRVNDAGVKVYPFADPCPSCGRAQVSGKTVQGTKTEHKCGAKCMASKGPTCECACGGANHGQSYV